jgi:hypothetical protein
MKNTTTRRAWSFFVFLYFCFFYMKNIKREGEIRRKERKYKCRLDEIFGRRMGTHDVHVIAANFSV